MSTFNRHNTEFYLEHLHGTTHRVGHTGSGTWALLTSDKPMDAAITLIDRVWAHGEPFFCRYIEPRMPRFRVTGERWDSDTGTIVPTDGLSLIVGSHMRNPSGTGKVTIPAGAVLTNSQQGESDGFYYYDTKPLRPGSFLFYEDGTCRSSLKGKRLWVLLWSLQVEPA